MTDEPDNVVPMREGKRPKRSMTPEQREKWRASVKKTNDKPASGIPAKGGWGGSAKGPGKDLTVAENRGQSVDCPRDEYGHPKRMPQKEAAAQELLETLYGIATDESQGGGVRVMAASAGLDRLEGKPVQRTITANADDLARLSDDELAAELARFGRAGT